MLYQILSVFNQFAIIKTLTDIPVDSQFVALKRYFLLTYTIKFNKTTTEK